jgi:hypothetical protein
MLGAEPGIELIVTVESLNHQPFSYRQKVRIFLRDQCAKTIFSDRRHITKSGLTYPSISDLVVKKQ